MHSVPGQGQQRSCLPETLDLVEVHRRQIGETALQETALPSPVRAQYPTWVSARSDVVNPQQDDDVLLPVRVPVEHLDVHGTLGEQVGLRGLIPFAGLRSPVNMEVVATVDPPAFFDRQQIRSAVGVEIPGFEYSRSNPGKFTSGARSAPCEIHERHGRSQDKIVGTVEEQIGPTVPIQIVAENLLKRSRMGDVEIPTAGRQMSPVEIVVGIIDPKRPLRASALEVSPASTDAARTDPKKLREPIRRIRDQGEKNAVMLQEIGALPASLP